MDLLLYHWCVPISAAVMNISVGSHNVFLQLHPAYCSSDDGSLLQQVSKYRPLVDWLTKFRPEARLHKISQITVCNASWVAKRLESVSIDVEFVSADGSARITQSFTLTDFSQTVLVPILKVNGSQYPILIRQSRAALGGEQCEEFFVGNVTADGFEGPNSALLKNIGFNLTPTALTELRPGNLSFADGLPPANFAKAELDAPHSDAQELLQVGGKTFPGGITLKALTISEVLASSSDLKTILACTLLQ